VLVIGFIDFLEKPSVSNNIVNHWESLAEIELFQTLYHVLRTLSLVEKAKSGLLKVLKWSHVKAKKENWLTRRNKKLS